MTRTRSRRPGAPPASTFASARAHHQAGRLTQAQALYRQVLAATPRHFDATSQLGLVALQSGRFDEAVAWLNAALRIDPQSAAAHNDLGSAQASAGRLDQARAAFERAVALQPSQRDALENLGLVLRRLGRPREAVEVLRRAEAAAPASARTLKLLGGALMEAGDVAGGVRVFEAAVALEPAAADAWSSLAAACLRSGQALRALECCERALQLMPDAREALGNKGSALMSLGRSREARACFERAVALGPLDAVAHANLGLLLRDDGQLDAAVTTLREALRLDPTLMHTRCTLIQVLQDRGDAAEALALARELVLQRPGSAAAHGVLGGLLIVQGDIPAGIDSLRRAAALPDVDAQTVLALANALASRSSSDDAVALYRRALELEPSSVLARWGQASANLRPIYADARAADAARAAYLEDLGALDRWLTPERTGTAFAAVGAAQPFYLAYQALDNRPLLEAHGRLCARVMAAWDHEPWSAPAPNASGRIRVGIASAQVHDHSVWNALTRGWVEHLDPQRFEVHVFNLGRGNDAQTAFARQRAAHFHDGQKTLQGRAAQIAGSALEVLIYPEIGMDMPTTQLASLRLAPLQMAAWGHPETTGLPTIDVYLSAQGFEPDGAAARYSERLVALPNLGVVSEPLAVAPIDPDLTALGLPDDEPLLLCPGTPFKYAPQHDRVWAEIARGLPRGRLVFFDGKRPEMAQQLAARLRVAFAHAGVDFDARARVIASLDRARFFGLMRRAALMLDTLGFSGFNTALQAVQCGLPIVAYEGEFMRGRLASAIMRRLGLPELVATDEAGYVRTVLRLAGDAAARVQFVHAVQARRGLLFNDLEPVRALERVLIEAAGR